MGVFVVQQDVPQSVAVFGHKGIKREDPDFFRAKFDRLGVEFTERHVPESNAVQFFLKEPNGFTVELQFPLG